VLLQLTEIQQQEMARAAWEGRLESVRLMLEFGFDPQQGTDHLGTAKALLAAGAKVDPDWFPLANPEIEQLFRKFVI
jgi:hypothetical protein